MANLHLLFLVMSIKAASVKFTAHFAGDNEYNASDSNEVSYEPKESTPTTKITTVLNLQEPSDVNPGDDIMVEGMLTSPEGTGIDKKEITLAATGIENLPTESTTDVTGGDGKFTFTIPGNALRGSTSLFPSKPPIGGELLDTSKPSIEANSVKFTAHFAGDTENNASDSNEVSYEPKGSAPTTKITTVLNLQEPSDVNPGDDIMVEGMLTSPEGTGIDKKEITLAATGIENLPTESTTDVTGGDGKFTFTIPGN